MSHHHLYKLKFYLPKNTLCAKAKNSVQPIQRRRCLKFQCSPVRHPNAIIIAIHVLHIFTLLLL